MLGSLVFYPFFLSVIPVVKVSEDMIVNTVLGGILVGIGVTFLYLSKGSSGGTSVLVRILIKYINIPFTIAAFIFDGTIICLGFVVFGLEAGVYALIMSGVSTMLVNTIESHLNRVYEVLINSKEDSIAHIISEFTDCEQIINKGGIYLCLVDYKVLHQFSQSLQLADANVKMFTKKSKLKQIK